MLFVLPRSFVIRLVEWVMRLKGKILRMNIDAVANERRMRELRERLNDVIDELELTAGCLKDIGKEQDRDMARRLLAERAPLVDLLLTIEGYR
jgi:hypothetical protein